MSFESITILLSKKLKEIEKVVPLWKISKNEY